MGTELRRHMTSVNQENTIRTAGTPDATPRTHPLTSERDPGGWTVVSPPGSSVVVRQRPQPDHIREAIARNLGVGTGAPREQ